LYKAAVLYGAALRRTVRMATGRKAVLEQNELCPGVVLRPDNAALIFCCSSDSAALRRTVRMVTGRKAVLEQNELCPTLF